MGSPVARGCGGRQKRGHLVDRQEAVRQKQPPSVGPVAEWVSRSKSFRLSSYQTREVEGGQRRRATNTVWSLQAYRLAWTVVKSGSRVVYYLAEGPQLGFIRE